MSSNPFLPFRAVLAALCLLVVALVPGAWGEPHYKVLYNFTGGGDGGEPMGLVQDAAGNLYGTTSEGGDPTCQCGVVYKVNKAGKVAVLHTFTDGTDGAFPYATLAISGNTLYGAASFGGNLHCYYDYGCGLLFEINIQTRSLKVLHTFNGSDGLYPSGALTLKSGVLYGTTILGGSSQNCGAFGCGLVYKLVLRTGAYSVLHSFDGFDGSSPESELTLDKKAKVLYGATAQGGSLNCYLGCGVAFRLSLKTRSYDVLYNFLGFPDVQYPYGPLSVDSSGNLYGDSQLGGAYPCPSDKGCGTVFMVNPMSGTDSVLHSFKGDADGNYPLAGVTSTSSGTLYGTTAWGGSHGLGTVFELVGHNKTVLHNFQGSDGSGSYSVVLMDSRGNLFGTAFNGGSQGSACGGYGCGVVWEITLH